MFVWGVYLKSVTEILALLAVMDELSQIQAYGLLGSQSQVSTYPILQQKLHCKNYRSE